MKKINVGSELIQGMENAVGHARGRQRAARETSVRVLAPAKPKIMVIRLTRGIK